MRVGQELEDLLEFLYASPVGIIEFDNSGSVRRINPQAVNILAPTFGFLDFDNIMPLFDRFAPELASLISSGDPVAGRLIDSYPVTARLPDRDSATVSFTLVRVVADRIMAVVAHDSPAVSFATLATRMESTRDTGELVAELAAAGADMFGAIRTSLAWPAEAGWMVAGDGRNASAGAAAPKGPFLVSSLGAVGEAVTTSAPVVAASREDIAGRFPGWTACAPQDGAEALVCVPVCDDTRVASVLFLEFRRPPTVDPVLIARVELLAGLAAGAFDRIQAHLAAIREQQADVLRRGFLEMVQSAAARVAASGTVEEIKVVIFEHVAALLRADAVDWLDVDRGRLVVRSKSASLPDRAELPRQVGENRAPERAPARPAG